MSVWNVPSNEDQPDVELNNWSIRASSKGLHFVGNEGYGAGRASSVIVSYDPLTKTGLTKSGRIYKLFGSENAFAFSDAEYTWKQWLHINKEVELFGDDALPFWNALAGVPEDPQDSEHDK